MKNTSALLFLLGVIFLSVAMTSAVYAKTDGGLAGALVAIYVFGLVAMSGILTIFPGGSKVRNEWGEKVRVGRTDNLSTAQAVSFLLWFVVFGAVVVYFVEFHNGS